MRKKNGCPFTREELINILIARRDELGRKPTRKDMPDYFLPYYRSTFGKWCYALEKTGIVIPSEHTLERRAKKKGKYDRLHKMMRAKKKAKKAEMGAEREATDTK